MTLHELLPHLKPWVDHLPKAWPGRVIKPQFAFWEVLHVLSLILVGGCSIVINLRLLGVGLTEEPASEIQRNLRKMLSVGILSLVITGLLIGAANAGRLYDSSAFTVKIICLVAGLILTFGASLPVARADGETSSLVQAMSVLGLALWGLGLWIFATSSVITPGLYHLLTAGALLLLIVTRGRTLIIYLSVLAALILVHQVVNHRFAESDMVVLDRIDNAFIGGYALWIGGVTLYRVLRSQRPPEGAPLGKLIAVATILVWITAAAAGRWIAFA